ncbi:SCP2 sterol-binding domain-containing protein [Amycolatopsis sp. K13G38]|uniref:SCP2 sterol-binding domain-containing protein n=1 Tax=Amycolatopsis acididurans TaxID=2724524 RepID=A0ABX1IWU6_9PSEU|nr:SCP2 sterol-binding domain-containing protein [Amycolatopsis acididurans]NKQ51957.1 SCP2 sterol-binding domain-containing protein [Amycolatopsis acididurans]
MSGFVTVDEVNRYIGGIFEKALQDDKIGPKLIATGMRLRMNFSDPDSIVTVDFAGQKVLTGAEADIEADAVLTMSADTANRYWQGKVSLPLAMAKGKLKIGGSASQLLRLAPVAKDLYPVYVEMLKADNRQDLVVS